MCFFFNNLIINYYEKITFTFWFPMLRNDECAC